MAISTFSGVRPADPNIASDIDIFYSYTTNRSTPFGPIIRLDPTIILSYTKIPLADVLDYDSGQTILEGTYQLTLPATIFNQIGVYSLIIKPKSLITNIVDCSVLAALPQLNGIVISTNGLPSNLATNGGLTGYRIEYINQNDTKLENVVRYVVSSNLCVPVSSNIGSSTQKNIQYQINNSGNLLFLQVTPSSSNSVTPNILPYIGTVGQSIIISNTFFSPLLIEVEMVSDDITSLSSKLLGNSIKNSVTGEYTLLDSETDEILDQYNLYEIKSTPDATTDLYEIRQKNTNIDATQTITNISSQYNLQL